MARFAREDLTGSPVGELWKRRILYEVGRTPSLLRKAGVISPPITPARVRSSHVHQLKRGLDWSPATFTLHFAALRHLLRWSKNPLVADRGAWSVPSGSSGRRRWLAPEQLARLYRSAQGREPVLLVLEAFNGLRRVEVLRLRYRDIDMDRQRLRVLGKGRNGGKWRTLPMFSETSRVLRTLPRSESPDARVVPLSRSGADLLLRRAADRAGFPSLGIRVSHHDLRRTFGRLSHQAGMDLVQLKNLYGHSSLDQTVHYIGLDEDEMRAGLERFASLMDPLLRKGSDRRPHGPRRGSDV
ncbi:MAG: site-specific integrase [Thermoplasmata archaeon]|nr:site-specific integrase [Thermoplasmata archaeon]